MYNLCRVGLKETEYSVSLSMWVVNDGGGGNGSSGIEYSKGVYGKDIYLRYQKGIFF